MKPILWVGYSYVVSILIAVVSNLPLGEYQNKAANMQVRADHPLMSGLADYKVAVMVVLVMVAGVPGIVATVQSVKRRQSAKLDLIKRLLRIVQTRSFPMVNGTASSVRISLFELSKEGSHLECVYRTDEKKPKVSWPIAVDEGFVVRVFRYQVTQRVTELDPANPADRARYLRDSWSTDTILEARSWKGAGMLGIPVTMKPGAHPAAVFLVETVGTEIEHHPLYDASAELCCMLMEDLT